MEQRQIITILGKQGSGKSQLTKSQIIESLPPPVFILDTMDEYSAGLCFYNMRSLKDQLKRYNKNASGVHVLKADNDEDAEEFFKLFASLKQPCSLIIEESSKFCTPYKINDDLSDIIAYGRHWNINLVMLARRPAELHKNVISNSNFIISFSQTESNDINKLSKAYDDAELLPELKYQEYEFMVFGKENVPEDFQDLFYLDEYKDAEDILVNKD